MVGAGDQSAADLDIVPCQGLIGCFGVPDWLIRIHSEEDTHWLPSNLLPLYIYSLIGSHSEIKKYYEISYKIIKILIFIRMYE